VHPTGRKLSRLSQLLTGVDRVTSRPLLTLTVLAADLGWIAYSISAGFPTRAEVVFQTLVAALTLGMVFVIQHTQSREQAATQRKLDEILYALPGADDAMLSLEHASDHELQATGDAHRAIREAAIDEAPAESPP
jgi:low affinity Fe/Cu permease